MKTISRCFVFLFLLLPHFVFAFVVGGNSYNVYNIKQFTFAYPDRWVVEKKTEIYGTNCITLEKKGSNSTEYEVLVCREQGKPSRTKLSEYGFNKTKKGKWEVAGAMDSVEGNVDSIENKMIVEAVLSCRFSDEDGVHSAGNCYKSIVVLDNEFFYIESRGHKSINNEFQIYRLISRSLVTTDKDNLDSFFKNSTPMKNKQPFTQ